MACAWAAGGLREQPRPSGASRLDPDGLPEVLAGIDNIDSAYIFRIVGGTLSR